MSPQSKSGGGGGMQKSGYEGSQLGVLDWTDSVSAGSDFGGSVLGGSDFGGADFGCSDFVVGGVYCLAAQSYAHASSANSLFEQKLVSILPYP
jgi:hypothetical protein